MARLNLGTGFEWNRDLTGLDDGPLAQSGSLGFGQRANSGLLSHTLTPNSAAHMSASTLANSSVPAGLFTQTGFFSTSTPLNAFHISAVADQNALAAADTQSHVLNFGGGVAALYHFGATSGAHGGPSQFDSSSSESGGPTSANLSDVSTSADEVSFISGVEANGNVYGQTLNSWNGDDPATFNSHTQIKWGSDHTTGTAGGTVTYYFSDASNWTDTEKNALISGLALWSAVANIQFAQASSASAANFVFNRGSDGGAHTNYSYYSGTIGATNDGYVSGQASINIDTSVGGFGDIGGPFSYYGGYSYDTLVHEEGHLIGLSHAGPYNGNVASGTQQYSPYDTRLWSIMSYIEPEDTGAQYYSSYSYHPTLNGNHSTTPMMLDIQAAQRIYGAPTSSPLDGNDIFGFNSNIGGSGATDSDGSIHRYFDFTNNTSPVVTLFDLGSNNTLDVTGFTQNATLNLTDGSFSSAGGLTDNIGIAVGTEIDNAYTGAGNDRVDGNSFNNVINANGGNDSLYGYGGADHLYGGADNDYLKGGGGADYLDGGTGINTADYATLTGTAGVNINLAHHTGSGGDAEGDTLYNIQNLLGSGYSDTMLGTSQDNNLSGASGNDYLDGGFGNDTLDGGIDYSGATPTTNSTVEYASDLAVTVDLSNTSAQDTGGAGIDTLSNFRNIYGSYFNDKLTGDTNGNFIYGYGGSDTLIGGGGNDTLESFNPIPYIVKASSTHNDSIAHAVSLDGVFNLKYDSNIASALSTPHATVVAQASGSDEYYAFTATAGATGTFDIDQTVLGTDTYLKIYDSTGTLIQSIDDGSLDDGSQSSLDSNGTVTFATAGVYYVDVGAYPNGATLAAGTQYTLNVSLTGATTAPNSGGSTFDGGDGDDYLEGTYDGSDTASYADATSAVTVSLAQQNTTQNTGGAGTDYLYSIENLSGSSYNDSLTGDSGDNRLLGGIGADSLYGGDGNDVYSVDDHDDIVIEATNQGTDTVLASISYTLVAGQSIEVLSTSSITGTSPINLTGNSASQTINGNAGSNTLDGEGGGDTLNGFGGNDTYRVRDAADVVHEAANQGADTIFAAVSYALLSGQSIEVLSTTSQGGTTAINLTGNNLAQTINGNAGANTISGGGGADSMHGFGGNDIYIADNSADLVFESSGGGTDTVYASANYALGAGQSIEYLGTTSQSGTAALSLTGNNLSQTINGNAGINHLDGFGGGDTLIGHAGNDIYIVRGAADQVIEANGEGADTVYSTTSYTLAAGQSIDTLATTAQTGTTAINLTGNNVSNHIFGNNGANAISGGGGSDLLYGYGGNDTIIGGAASDTIDTGNGRDVVRFNQLSDSTGVNRDVIMNMNLSGTDKFDFPVVPTSIHAQVDHGALNTASFDSDLAAAISTSSQLGAHQAVLFDPDGGDLNVAGHVFLIVDVNGHAGYQAGQDYVVELVGSQGQLTTDDFI